MDNPSQNPPLPGRLLPVVFLVFLGFLAFAPSLNGWEFGDDYQYWTRKIASHPGWFFTHKNPLHIYAYRPIEFAVLWIFQDLSPRSTFPVHLTQLLLHLAIGGTVIHLMVRAGSGLRVAWTAGLVFVVSQASVHAVGSLDTLSQQLETLAGLSALHALDRWALQPRRWLWLGASSLLYALSILSKELSLSLSVMFVAYVAVRVSRKELAPLRGLLSLSPHAAISLAYLWARHILGLPSGGYGEGMYDFNLHHNLLVNPLMALAQSALPLPSPEVFLWVRERWIPGIALAALLVAGGVLIPLWGYVQARDWRRPTYLALGFSTSICIGLAMNHISELYVYSSLPFFAWYFAQGMGHLWKRHPGIWSRACLGTFIVGYLATNTVSTHMKSSQIEANGRCAHALVAQLETIIRGSARDQLIVLQETGTEPTYSIFRQHGFGRIAFAPSVLCNLNRRTDLRIEWRTAREAHRPLPSGSIGLRIESDSILVPLAPQLGPMRDPSNSAQGGPPPHSDREVPPS